MSKIYYFRGKAMWTKVDKPDPKYGHYTLDLYLDPDSFELFKESKLQLKIRENEEGEKYIKLRRTPEKKVGNELINIGPPAVHILGMSADPEKFNGKIGNGSEVVCKVRVYDTPRGLGHELMAIGIENLVVYEGAEVVNEEEFPF